MRFFLISCCILTIMLGFTAFTNPVHAAEPLIYESLVDLPIPSGLEAGGEGGYTTQDYIKILYALSISIAALLAVVKIIFGGVKYMLSDVVTDKAGAKKDIRGALLGLLIVIGAVVILDTINPQLRTLTLLTNAPAVGIQKAEPRGNVSICDTNPSSLECKQKSCGPGSKFVETAENPAGSCISTTPIGDDEDYTDSPGEGRVRCSPLSYDENTNSCYDERKIELIPDYVIQGWEENSGGDPQNVIIEGRQYCSSQGKNYIESQKACIAP